MNNNTLTTFWQKANRHIFRKKIPHAILSWRYFIPRQSQAVLLHRNVFLNAWPAFPRYLWGLIAVYSYLSWYLYLSWRQIWRAWYKHSAAIYNDQGVSRVRQYLDLLILGLGHSTPPVFYYLYKLYRVPESHWLNFIYTHELPHWHQLMSPALSADSRDLLTHKDAFAVAMNKIGLPAVETICRIAKGGNVSAELFQARSLFLKPENGSRRQGCYTLQYNAREDRYCLQSAGQSPGSQSAGTIEGIEKIIEQLKTEFQQYDYIVQPLLENHEDLRRWFDREQLITVRLVTINDLASVTHVLCANLEIPVANTINTVYAVPVDVRTGKLSEFTPAVAKDADSAAFLHETQGKQLPLWDHVINAAKRAHQCFKDIKTVGWDFAITNDGVKLLEGNINWDVAAHQINSTPLLTDYLQACNE